MSTGNLNGKLVKPQFWPACENCKFYQECQKSPRHRAFPHSWHWGREKANFSEGDLIIISWVGTIEIGARHTGCYAYSIEESNLLPLSEKHQKYLELEKRRQALDKELDRHEKQGLYNRTIQQKYNEYELILGQQERLLEKKEVEPIIEC